MGIPSVQAWNETRRPSEVDESNGPISSVGAWNDVTSHRHKSQGVGLKKKNVGSRQNDTCCDLWLVCLPVENKKIKKEEPTQWFFGCFSHLQCILGGLWHCLEKFRNKNVLGIRTVHVRSQRSGPCGSWGNGSNVAESDKDHCSIKKN